MAINPNTQYPGKTVAPSAGYPGGSARNITVPGDGTGTPWEQALVNEIFGFQQALLNASGIVASGAVETALVSEYMQSVVELAAGRARYVAHTGASAADAYVVDSIGALVSQRARSLFNGLTIEYVQPNGMDNTGASTMAAFGLAVKPIVTPTGTALAGTRVSRTEREILAGDRIRLVYSTTFSSWVLYNTDRPRVESAEFDRSILSLSVFAMGSITAAGVLMPKSDINILSITKSSAGQYDIFLNTPRKYTNTYNLVATLNNAPAGATVQTNLNTAADRLRVLTFNTTPAPSDRAFCFVAFDLGQ